MLCRGGVSSGVSRRSECLSSRFRVCGAVVSHTTAAYLRAQAQEYAEWSAEDEAPAAAAENADAPEGRQRSSSKDERDMRAEAPWIPN